MANALYDLAREAFLNGNIDWTNNTIRAILVDSADYTVNLATHEFFSDITVAGRVGNSGGTSRADGVALGTKTTTAGVADAADATLTAVTGDPCEYICIYVDDASADATSRLIALIDTATGLPVTPNGGDITFQWDSGANKIFKL